MFPRLLSIVLVVLGALNVLIGINVGVGGWGRWVCRETLGSSR
jgi:hypothetical protein